MNDPKPAQNRTESDERPESGLPAVQGAREARYAEAMRRSPNGPWMTLPGPTDIAPSFVRAVLPLVDAEVAAAVSEAKAEAQRYAAQADRAEADRVRQMLRATAAEAEVERLREGIRALAESIHGDSGWAHNGGCQGEPDCFACIELDLLALLAPSPAATTGEAGRTLGCMWCDEESCDHGAMQTPAPVSSGEAGP